LKKFFAILIGLIVVPVGVVLVVPSFVDWNAYKPEITAAVEEQTGRKLTIGGAIELQVLPSPRLSVADVRLSNSVGASEPDMVRLGSMQVHVALQPLLSGTIQILSVTLIRPVISLERLADGSVNWVFADPPSATTTAGARAGASGSPASDVGTAISLDGADVIDGTVIYRDTLGNRTHRIENVDATIVVSSLEGPFSAKGALTYQGLKAEFQASLGKIDSGGTAMVNLSMALPEHDGGASFEGTLGLDRGPSAQGNLTVRAKELARLASALVLASGGEATLPPMLAKPMELSAKIFASPERAEVNDLIVQLGDARLQGTMRADLGATVSVDAKFSLGRLDLDKFGVFVANETAPVGASDASRALGAVSLGAGFTLPADARVKVAISADAIDYRGETIRQIRIDGVLEQGAVTIDLLTAQLPGGTNLTVTGTLYADAGLPRFIGRTDVVSDNLRNALGWLDVPLDRLAADRLRKGVFGADVDASPEQVQLSKWTVDIDNTTISGGLSLLLRDRPAFGLSLIVDKINLDAYLPAKKQGKAAAETAALTAAGSKPTENTAAEITALLSSFDANLLLKVAEARFRGSLIRDVALDATVQSGEILIRDLSIKDVGGAALQVEGKLAGTIAQPSSDINVTVAAKSVARLARLAGIEVPDTVQKLGGFEFQSKILGSLDSLTLDSVLQIAGGRLDLKGVVEPLGSPVGLDLALKLAHPHTERLVAFLVDEFAPRRIALGPGVLAASILTRSDLGVDIDASLNLLAGRLALKGVVHPFAAKPAIDAQVYFDHPDVVSLIRLGALEFKPSRRDFGAVSLASTITGSLDLLTLTGISISAGPTTLSGAGRIELGGQRPKISLKLAADALEVDPWLAAKIVKAKGVGIAVPVRSSGREWSRERIDLGVLRTIDTELELVAKNLTYSSYIINDFALAADLVGGKLTLQRFGGGIFGGKIAAAGRLVAVDTPAMEISLKVEQADIRQAAQAAASADRVRGVFDYEAALSTRGFSEFEMVSSLQGTGKVTVRDGVVEGIDLEAVSEQLKKLDGALDFLVLAQKAMNGGSSPIDRLSGTYTITDGILRSDDIILRSRTASGKARAVINLPSQEVDVQSRFWLSEHLNSPPIGVRHVGPLTNPRMVLDIEKLQAYVLQRVVQRGILRQFGGAKIPDAELTVPVETNKLPALDKIKPREALQSILKGLMK
jgi:uncharacterized protein involved in outer membrane biogenesis